jgi:hypothetical protein
LVGEAMGFAKPILPDFERRLRASSRLSRFILARWQRDSIVVVSDQREIAMRVHILLGIGLGTVSSALSQTAPPAAGHAPAVASVPDFSGVWRHSSLPWFAPPASGAGPVTNLARRNGVSDSSQLVGDYANPILQPWAAQIIKAHGDVSLAGATYPNPANQCWPEPVPFIFKNNGMQILQQNHQVTLLYDENHQFRQARLNEPHPANVKPSWHGDSVGRYEGDTLVIDTVAVKTDRPFAMIDLFGTPYTQALHVIERYRLLDYEGAKDGLERDAKENYRPEGNLVPNDQGKWLQIEVTVEDDGASTMPWSATVSYGTRPGPWTEKVCAENRLGFFSTGSEAAVPTAKISDF